MCTGVYITLSWASAVPVRQPHAIFYVTLTLNNFICLDRLVIYVSVWSGFLLPKARNSKSKQSAAAAAKAAAAAAAATASATANTTTAAPTTLPSTTTATTTPNRKTTAKSAAGGVSKGRAPVVNVTAGTAASLLGSRAHGAMPGSQNSSLLAGLGKATAVGVRVASPATATTIHVAKQPPPVVTVTKQGLTPGSSRAVAGGVGATKESVGSSSSGGGGVGLARPSPLVLTKEAVGSRSSTPTTAVSAATPPPPPPHSAGKLVTLAQTAGGVGGAGASVVVTGAGDSAVLTQLVQQVARGQQVVSVPARSLGQMVAGQPRGTTLKIQG